MIKKSNERGGMIGGTEGDTLSSLLIYLVYFKPEIALSQSTKSMFALVLHEPNAMCLCVRVCKWGVEVPLV